MRGIFKRFIAIGMCVFLLVTSSTEALAAERDVNVRTSEIYQINEYDLYLSLEDKSTEQLKQMGYSAKQIEDIMDFSVEDALIERAGLSDQELVDYGYSKDQIEILRNYDGGSLGDNPQLRAAMSDFTGSLSPGLYTNFKMTAAFSWQWSSRPLWSGTGIVDDVGCAFAGVDVNNNLASLEYVSSNCKCTVQYYTGTTKASKVNMSTIDKNLNKYIEYGVKLSADDIDNGLSWAKSGTLQVGVQESVVANRLGCVYFLFSYGHVTATLQAGLNFFVGTGTIDLSVTPVAGTTQMFKRTIKLESDGDCFVVFLDKHSRIGSERRRRL